MYGMMFITYLKKKHTSTLIIIQQNVDGHNFSFLLPSWNKRFKKKIGKERRYISVRNITEFMLHLFIYMVITKLKDVWQMDDSNRYSDLKI